MFVPSLSWQNDRFLYINGSEMPFSAGRSAGSCWRCWRRTWRSARPGSARSSRPCCRSRTVRARPRGPLCGRRPWRRRPRSGTSTRSSSCGCAWSAPPSLACQGRTASCSTRRRGRPCAHRSQVAPASARSERERGGRDASASASSEAHAWLVAPSHPSSVTFTARRFPGASTAHAPPCGRCGGSAGATRARLPRRRTSPPWLCLTRDHRNHLCTVCEAGARS